MRRELLNITLIFMGLRVYQAVAVNNANINRMSKKINSYIILVLLSLILLVGVVNATTIIIYPNSSVAPYAQNKNDTFSVLKNETSNQNGFYVSGNAEIDSNTRSGTFKKIQRAMFLFNIPAYVSNTKIIDNITFTVVGWQNSINLGNTAVGITGYIPTNIASSVITASDFRKYNDTLYSDDYPMVSTFNNNNALINWTFNANGLASVNRTYPTGLMMRLKWDITGNFDSTWAASRSTAGVLGNLSTSYLTITYHDPPSPPDAAFTTDKTDGNTSLTVAFTDTSTNTPTSWNWYWADGTANGTTQNPSHTFTTPGVYNVTLTATNAVGSGTSGATRIGACDPNGWYDSLATDSSSHYGNQNSDFTWDTTNHVLVSDATDGGVGAMTFYKDSPFYGGVYQINWTPKAFNSGWYDDYYAEYLIGAQSFGTGEFYTSHVPMYAIYMKRSIDEGYNAMVIDRVYADGTHIQANQNNSFNPVLNHKYNVTAVWNTGTTTNVIQVYVDGVLTVSADDATPITHAGYFGFSVHDGATTTTWYDNVKINNQSVSTNSPVAAFTSNKNFMRIPISISVTDTSTNTPTSWQWSWGDGSANSTTQNPTHKYTKRGRFSIYLTATNAGGSGSSSATVVRVVGYDQDAN